MKENKLVEKVNSINVNFHQNEKPSDNIDDLLIKYHIDIKKYISLIKPTNTYNRENVIKRGELFDLSCPICLNLLNNPISCSSNENSHSFCKECIDYYLKNNNCCPICKCNFEYKIKEKVKKMLVKLLFRCIYYKEGCKKIISYAEYLKHINECEYKNKNCLYECLVEKYNYDDICFEECKFSGNMEKIKEHFKNCAFSKFKCLFCNYYVLSINLKYHMQKYCKFKIINYENGEKYVGEIKNHKREGYGRSYDLNDIKYEGEWKNDKKEGYGIIIFPDGSKLEGEWRDNKIEGIGILNLSNGSKFIGEFKDNEKDGYGTFSSKYGKYEGEFKEGYMEGYGILNFKNGNIYEGQWKNNEFNGYGLFKMINELKYEGFWKNNIKEGFGILSTLEHVYKGQWKDDKKDGYGILASSSNNIIFQGEWKNNVRDGYGISYFHGNIFKGYFENDAMTGYGIFYLRNGTKIEGEFKNDNLDGYVIFENINGLIYKGNFKNNMKEGIGIFSYTDKIKIEIEFKNDEKEVFGIIYYLNQKFLLKFNAEDDFNYSIKEINIS